MEISGWVKHAAMMMQQPQREALNSAVDPSTSFLPFENEALLRCEERSSVRIRIKIGGKRIICRYALGFNGAHRALAPAHGHDCLPVEES